MFKYPNKIQKIFSDSIISYFQKQKLHSKQSVSKIYLPKYIIRQMRYNRNKKQKPMSDKSDIFYKTKNEFN